MFFQIISHYFVENSEYPNKKRKKELLTLWLTSLNCVRTYNSTCLPAGIAGLKTRVTRHLTRIRASHRTCRLLACWLTGEPARKYNGVTGASACPFTGINHSTRACEPARITTGNGACLLTITGPAGIPVCLTAGELAGNPACLAAGGLHTGGLARVETGEPSTCTPAGVKTG